MRRLRHPLILFVALAAILFAGVSVAGADGNDGPAVEVPPAQPPIAEAGSRSPRPPAASDLSYVAITPCRVLDTREAGGTMTNTERTFAVAGNLTAQGGGASCGIPASATAVALNLTAISAGGSTGYVRGRKAGGPVATTSLLNFSPALNASNAVNQPVSATGMQLKTSGSADLVGDVQGYYSEQMQGMVASDGSIYSGTSHLVSATVINPGVYRVTFDRDVSYCTPLIDTYSGKGVYGTAYGFAGTSIYVYTWYISGSTHLEVNNSYYFYIHVAC